MQMRDRVLSHATGGINARHLRTYVLPCMQFMSIVCVCVCRVSFFLYQFIEIIMSCRYKYVKMTSMRELS